MLDYKFIYWATYALCVIWTLIMLIAVSYKLPIRTMAVHWWNSRSPHYPRITTWMRERRLIWRKVGTTYVQQAYLRERKVVAPYITTCAQGCENPCGQCVSSEHFNLTPGDVARAESNAYSKRLFANRFGGSNA